MCTMRSHISNGFNTQPPEGGWNLMVILMENPIKFQHTAA